MSAGVFDIVLALLLPLMAGAVLVVRDLFRAIVFFIVFGLTVALLWLRLGAPDVALAEAAVGAGITGVLFMRALGGLAGRDGTHGIQSGVEYDRPVLARRDAPGGRTAGAFVVLLATGILVWSFSSIPAHDTSLGARVGAALPGSGVKNPVTAVLLDFRGYDTLLEVGVLVVAALAVMIIGAPRHSPLLSETSVRGPVLSTFAHLVVPAMVLAAGYLLWKGADSPGGAFQGAAILAGAWLLAAFAGFRLDVRAFAQRAILAGGFAIFLAVALALAFAQGTLLDYDAVTAKWWMLTIETGLLVSCAAILATLVFNLVDDEGAGDWRQKR